MKLATAITAIIALGSTHVHGYALEGVKWPVPTVTFQMELGEAGRTLQDGNTSWNSAAAETLTRWNQVVQNVVLDGVTNASGAAMQFWNGINEIGFADTINGYSFGAGVIAVTMFDANIYEPDIKEADILLNTAIAFDSYRGALQYRIDIQRVMLHELGHAIGLAHPDQAGQTVAAIMNSSVSNLDALQSDDIAGGQFIYGAPEVTPAPSPTPVKLHLVNISTRGFVGTGERVLIGGFIVKGNASEPKKIIIRAIGPTLTAAGVTGALSDPILELYDSAGALIDSNNDWQLGTHASEISASGIAPLNQYEAALLESVPPGNYTAIVRGALGKTGLGLIEVYDLEP